MIKYYEIYDKLFQLSNEIKEFIDHQRQFMNQRTLSEISQLLLIECLYELQHIYRLLNGNGIQLDIEISKVPDSFETEPIQIMENIRVMKNTIRNFILLNREIILALRFNIELRQSLLQAIETIIDFISDYTN